MSETTDPGQTPDATPTEALQLADQQPIAAPVAPVAQKSGGSHTRTILEVVGGVVAAGLIVVAGVLGFAVGHVSGSDNDRGRTLSFDMRGDRSGPEAGGPMGGQQGRDMMPGQQGQDMMPGQQGQDPRGIDPDGDNWTGGGMGQQGQGMMPGQVLPTTPQQ
jgi:hypothetical protein